MPTLRQILFPYDFSAAGSAAIPYIRSIANRFHAKVTVLSIVPPEWVSPPGLIPQPLGSDPAALQDALRRQLDEIPLEGFEQPLARLTMVGDPALKIAEVTRDHGIDLVALPTHGHGLFRALLLGSVTAKVLHDVACPVWTAAHAEKQHAAITPRKILCALDGSEKNMALARWAFELSREFEANLQYLHVVRIVSDWLGLESEQALQEEMRTESRKRMEEMLRSGGLEAPLRVAVGEIVDAISEEARQESADLIVLGRGAAHETLGRLRTHAHGIIQRAPCPVISV